MNMHNATEQAYKNGCDVMYLFFTKENYSIEKGNVKE